MTHFPPPAPAADAAAPLDLPNLQPTRLCLPVAHDSATGAWSVSAGPPAAAPVPGDGTAAAPPATPSDPGADAATPPSTPGVDAAEPPAPPPDEVALLLQVNPEFTDKAAADAELRAFCAFVEQQRPPELPPPSVIAVQVRVYRSTGKVWQIPCKQCSNT